MSISVNDVLGVAGFVLPGDRVDVMLTRNEASGPFVDILLQGERRVGTVLAHPAYDPDNAKMKV